jgi:shikimate kinase
MVLFKTIFTGKFYIFVKNKKMKIALYGFMGAGKTVLGKALSERLHYNFIDLDNEIQSFAQLSINEIFENQGETAFRRIEHQTLKNIVKQQDDNIVLALGGGAVLQPFNRKLLQLTGYKTIYLNVDIQVLIERLKNDKNKRPLLKNIDNDSFSQYVIALFESRKNIYKKYADMEFIIGQENFETVLERLYLHLNFN